LQQAAAEVRAIDTLARIGKEQLLYHVADVLIIVGDGGPTATIEVKRKVYIHDGLTCL
jgi:hypothetical protein